MELADELERLRYEKGLSYRKLADICRLNQHTMRNALIHNEYEYLMGRIDVLADAQGADANELRMKYPYPPEDEATCFGTHRYERILEAVRGGESDAQIMAEWPELTDDVLMVYHKIADGRLCQWSKNGGMYGKHDTAIANLHTLALYNGTHRLRASDENGLYIRIDDELNY